MTKLALTNLRRSDVVSGPQSDKSDLDPATVLQIQAKSFVDSLPLRQLQLRFERCSQKLSIDELSEKERSLVSKLRENLATANDFAQRLAVKPTFSESGMTLDHKGECYGLLLVSLEKVLLEISRDLKEVELLGRRSIARELSKQQIAKNDAYQDAAAQAGRSATHRKWDQEHCGAVSRAQIGGIVSESTRGKINSLDPNFFQAMPVLSLHVVTGLDGERTELATWLRDLERKNGDARNRSNSLTFDRVYSTERFPPISSLGPLKDGQTDVELEIDRLPMNLPFSSRHKLIGISLLNQNAEEVSANAPVLAVTSIFGSARIIPEGENVRVVRYRLESLGDRLVDPELVELLRQHLPTLPSYLPKQQAETLDLLRRESSDDLMKAKVFFRSAATRNYLHIWDPLVAKFIQDAGSFLDEATAALGMGDCDTLAQHTCLALRRLGLPVIVAVGPVVDPETKTFKWNPSHALVLAPLESGVMSYDLTNYAKPAWEIDGSQVPRKIWKQAYRQIKKGNAADFFDATLKLREALLTTKLKDLSQIPEQSGHGFIDDSYRGPAVSLDSLRSALEYLAIINEMKRLVLESLEEGEFEVAHVFARKIQDLLPPSPKALASLPAELREQTLVSPQELFVSALQLAAFNQDYPAKERAQHWLLVSMVPLKIEQKTKDSYGNQRGTVSPEYRPLVGFEQSLRIIEQLDLSLLGPNSLALLYLFERSEIASRLIGLDQNGTEHKILRCPLRLLPLAARVGTAILGVNLDLKNRGRMQGVEIAVSLSLLSLDAAIEGAAQQLPARQFQRASQTITELRKGILDKLFPLGRYVSEYETLALTLLFTDNFSSQTFLGLVSGAGLASADFLKGLNPQSLRNIFVGRLPQLLANQDVNIETMLEVAEKLGATLELAAARAEITAILKSEISRIDRDDFEVNFPGPNAPASRILADVIDSPCGALFGLIDRLDALGAIDREALEQDWPQLDEHLVAKRLTPALRLFPFEDEVFVGESNAGGFNLALIPTLASALYPPPCRLSLTLPLVLDTVEPWESCFKKISQEFPEEFLELVGGLKQKLAVEDPQQKAPDLLEFYLRDLASKKTNLAGFLWGLIDFKSGPESLMRKFVGELNSTLKTPGDLNRAQALLKKTDFVCGAEVTAIDRLFLDRADSIQKMFGLFCSMSHVFPPIVPLPDTLAGARDIPELGIFELTSINNQSSKVGQLLSMIYRGEKLLKRQIPPRYSLDHFRTLGNACEERARNLSSQGRSALVAHLRGNLLVRGVFGLGDDYAHLAEYSPGDDIRKLDWKAFGRSDRLYTRKSQAQGSAPLICFVDLDRLSDGFAQWETAELFGEHTAVHPRLKELHEKLYLAERDGQAVRLVVYARGFPVRVIDNRRIDRSCLASDSPAIANLRMRTLRLTDLSVMQELGRLMSLHLRIDEWEAERVTTEAKPMSAFADLSIPLPRGAKVLCLLDPKNLEASRKSLEVIRQEVQRQSGAMYLVAG